jgi:hypothetical protein
MFGKLRWQKLKLVRRGEQRRESITVLAHKGFAPTIPAISCRYEPGD